MASDYGLNFGFRRSDESVRLSEGRMKTPVAAPRLRIGTAVEINSASAGYLKQSANGVKIRPGTSGLLIQEEDWDRTIYESTRLDSFGLGLAYQNRLSVITTGAGTKVWMKNTASQTRADGRVIDAVAIFTATSVAVGRGLKWNGTLWVDDADPTADTSFLEVTYFDSAKAYLEAVLTK